MRNYRFSSVILLTLFAFNVCSGGNDTPVGSNENFQSNQSILVDNIDQKSTDFNYQEYRRDYKASISSSIISVLNSFEEKYKDHDPDLLIPFVAEKKADLIAYWSSHAYSNYVNLNKCADWEAFIIEGSLKNKYIEIAKTIVDLCANGFKIISTKEIVLLQHAAEAGNIASMNRLAESFQKGHGVAINYLTAIDWYNKASSSNSTIAKLALGRLYTGGLGVESDINRAIEYFKEASELGSNAAKFELGKIFFYGNGVEKTTQKL